MMCMQTWLLLKLGLACIVSRSKYGHSSLMDQFYVNIWMEKIMSGKHE